MIPEANIYLKSQIGRLSEDLKKAFLANVHIVYVVTQDYEVISETLRRQPLILTRNRNMPTSIGNYKMVDGVKVSEPNRVLPKNLFYSENDLECGNGGVPSIYVISPRNSYEATNKALRSFVARTTGMCDTEEAKKVANSMAIIVSSKTPEVPEDISPYCRIIYVRTPDEWEVRETIKEAVMIIDKNDITNKPSAESYLHLMVQYMRGMSKAKILQTMSRIKYELDKVFIEDLSHDNKTLKAMLAIIIEEKSQMIENSGILKMQKVGSKAVDGMENFQRWIDERVQVVRNPEEAKASALIRMPKGVLLSGIPGTGKSLAAKTVARKIGNMPLIRLDMGDIMDKYQGESERKMGDALVMAEAMSPCILWIDEIEKGISGANGKSEGNDAMKRIFGKLLTWMQEKENKNVCCFVFATANGIANIPPELFRSGRFDEKFYTFMPSQKECIDIFVGNIKRQNAEYNGLGKAKLKDCLFEESIADRKFFADFLDSDDVLQDKSWETEGRAPRCNKFMTGADIEALIEKAKLLLYNKHNGQPGNKRCSYLKQDFMEALKEAIEDTRTYGQTNSKDVAECFVQLEENVFVSVSGKDKELVVPFAFLDPLRPENGEPAFDLTGEEAEKHRQNLGNEYDRQLFRYVGLAVNQILAAKRTNDN